jgi:hypothetical protein
MGGAGMPVFDAAEPLPGALEIMYAAIPPTRIAHAPSAIYTLLFLI